MIVSHLINDVARKFILNCAEHRFCFWIKIFAFIFESCVTGVGNDLTFFGIVECIYVDVRVLVGDLGLFGRSRIDFHDGLFVPSDVRNRVKFFIIKGVKLRGNMFAKIRR